MSVIVRLKTPIIYSGQIGIQYAPEFPNMLNYNPLELFKMVADLEVKSSQIKNLKLYTDAEKDLVKSHLFSIGW